MIDALHHGVGSAGRRDQSHPGVGLDIDAGFFERRYARQQRRALRPRRLRSRYNVAVAEIDFQDIWQRSLISAVTVSGSHSYAEQTLQQVEREAASLLGPALVDVTVEWIE